MTETLNRLSRLFTDRRGVTALEYGLIAAAVVAIGLAGFSVIGTNLSTKFNTVNTALDSAEPAAAAPGN